MKKEPNKKIGIRFNTVVTIIYIVGIVLLLRLFTMQIIEGKDYRAKSSLRLIKKTDIEPTRGRILDRSGEIYADSELVYDVEIYRAKVSNEELNNLSLFLMNILEESGEKYDSKLPITINPFAFKEIKPEEMSKWKEDLDIPKEASAKEAFYRLKENYDIQLIDENDIRKTLELREILRQDSYGSIYGITISKNVKKSVAVKILENSDKLPGVNINTKSARKYVKENEASHILGYIAPINEEEYKARKDQGYKNDDKIGKVGLEAAFEEVLKGKKGEKQVDISVDGKILGEYITKNAVGGSDVILTIDAKLQKATEEALVRHVNNVRAGKMSANRNVKGAACVALDIKTGDILAIASYPDYNPNKFINGINVNEWNAYNDPTLTPLVNRSIRGLYAPASTFKMLTTIAGLSEGAVKVDEGIVCRGIYPKAHRPVCWIYNSTGGGHGWQNARLAIKNSCNYYMYEVGDRIGIDKIEEYAKKFHLGEKTGIELLDESSGVVASKEAAKVRGEEWTLGGLYSAAVGQSYHAYTPLQLARYIAMLAARGRQIEPTLIKSVINPNGSHMSRKEIEEIVYSKSGFERNKQKDLEIKSEYFDAVLGGMRDLIRTSGYFQKVFSGLNVQVAGKTGTAEAGANVNGLFGAFAPYNDPEIAVYAVVENGREGFYTSNIVKDVMAAYFNKTHEIVKDNVEAVEEGEFLIY